jgi:hypothetical protein
MLVRSAQPLKETQSVLSLRQRPLALGLSVGHPLGSTGSIGGFVASKSDPSLRGLLSSATCLCPQHARLGDFIHQPGPVDNRMFVGETRVARLHPDFAPSKGPRSRLDCAFAVLLDDVSVLDNMVPPSLDGPLSGRRIGYDADVGAAALPGERVAKVGRGTGLTVGRIDAIGLNGFAVTIGKSSRLGEEEQRSFDNVIAIAGEGGHFSGPGDSGATVFSLDRGVVLGLLFASARDSKQSKSYAHPIGTVLDKMGLVWA